MDAVYYLSGTVMTVVVLVLLIAAAAFLVKPHLLNDRKIIKKPFSRLKIVLVALIATTITLFGFGSVMAATEPVSVKESRAAAESERQKSAQPSDTTAPKVIAPVRITKEESNTEVIPFGLIEEQSASLPKGQSKVTTDGVNGEKTLYYEVTYVDGKEESRQLKNEIITKQPIKKVTSIGTYVAPAPKPAAKPSNSCNPNYSGCVPNVSYDLNCKDIGQKVKVLGRDQYNLDGDNDGWGCDSY